MKYSTLMHLKYHLPVPITLQSIDLCNINEGTVITHLYGTIEKYMSYIKAVSVPLCFSRLLILNPFNIVHQFLNPRPLI